MDWMGLLDDRLIMGLLTVGGLLAIGLIIMVMLCVYALVGAVFCLLLRLVSLTVTGVRLLTGKER